ncbi:hypothetical protein E2C01_010451 [Portunus trituberculatus]|uniref:Uncharacterized protein n=1 Tax=Portunus trituberculatus TaxID=210409 RepID=A0A5B7D8E5_PORTR|nr:hypothetical protein [Portunus trituberculatus]
MLVVFLKAYTRDPLVKRSMLHLFVNRCEHCTKALYLCIYLTGCCESRHCSSAPHGMYLECNESLLRLTCA